MHLYSVFACFKFFSSIILCFINKRMFITYDVSINISNNRIFKAPFGFCYCTKVWGRFLILLPALSCNQLSLAAVTL